MKNKGFTLIELLVVMAIISVIGIVITINLTRSLDNANQSRCDEFVEEVENAACVYASLAKKTTPCNRNFGTCNLQLKDLVNDGMINSETDACTRGDLDLNAIITVTWDSNGEKSCEYKGVKVYAK